MKRTWIVALVVGVILAGLLATVAVADPLANISIGWSVFSGGGAQATAGNVTLNGSLGQTASGVLASASHDASAGFWLPETIVPGAEEPAMQNRLLLPVIMNAPP